MNVNFQGAARSIIKDLQGIIVRSGGGSETFLFRQLPGRKNKAARMPLLGSFFFVLPRPVSFLPKIDHKLPNVKLLFPF